MESWRCSGGLWCGGAGIGAVEQPFFPLLIISLSFLSFLRLSVVCSLSSDRRTILHFSTYPTTIHPMPPHKVNTPQPQTQPAPVVHRIPAHHAIDTQRSLHSFNLHPPIHTRLQSFKQFFFACLLQYYYLPDRPFF